MALHMIDHMRRESIKAGCSAAHVTGAGSAQWLEVRVYGPCDSTGLFVAIGDGNLDVDLEGTGDVAVTLWRDDEVVASFLYSTETVTARQIAHAARAMLRAETDAAAVR